MLDNIIIPGSICARLIDAGIITTEQLKEALEIQKTSKQLIGTILTQLGYCTEEDVARMLASKTGHKFVSIDEVGVNIAVANLITPELAVKNNILPIYEEDGIVYVAMKNPNDILTVDYLRMLTGHEICPVVAADLELQAAIENFANMNSGVDNYDDEEEEVVVEAENLDIDDKPAVQLVNQVINNAIKAGASDIHIEALEKYMRVRFRIDGVLQEIMQNPIKMYSAVISRIKVIGGMDIAERRIPQDGRATVKFEDKTMDVRIASMPTVYGEKVVMRLLERSNTNVVTLKDIKFSPRQFDRFNHAIHMPYGFVLVTGPTGSGKSTTLYATLAEISTLEKNVITLEDPVERRMAGINQVQMNNRAGMTFAAALRSVLRSDPDIVMVGEIRDSETAKIAVEAALTGHMVLSTLHTNDAPGAVTRLDEMGVEPFLTASSLVGVLAQRLVRRLCPKCKEEYEISHAELKSIVPDLETYGYNKPSYKLYKAHGCLTCNNTGYKGREAVFEFLTVTEEMKRLILDRATIAQVRDLAVSQEMKTLKDEGLYKMMEGSTSLEEVLRVIV
ncbi:MAG: Flp pilus assembly complex ATPase component TadA [Clostridia bacterium]|nr:Flp pilus assembly complex ATPase component TadA [Clostridia bacterium]